MPTLALLNEDVPPRPGAGADASGSALQQATRAPDIGPARPPGSIPAASTLSSAGGLARLEQLAYEELAALNPVRPPHDGDLLEVFLDWDLGKPGR